MIIRVATGQGNSRSGKSQGILEFVREIWNFVESQGNLRKFIFHKRLRSSITISKNFQLAPSALPSYFLTLLCKFAIFHKDLLFETYTDMHIMIIMIYNHTNTYMS